MRSFMHKFIDFMDVSCLCGLHVYNVTYICCAYLFILVCMLYIGCHFGSTNLCFVPPGFFWGWVHCHFGSTNLCVVPLGFFWGW